FPWTVLQPAGQQVAALMRSAGMLPPLPEPPAPPVPEPEPERLVTTVNTHIVNFEMTIVNNGDPRIVGSASTPAMHLGGGGLALTANGILIGQRFDGVLQFFDRAADTVRDLPFK